VKRTFLWVISFDPIPLLV